MIEPRQIPIENIYYLFCYAWDRFEEGRAITAGADLSPDLPNLLARVLAAGTQKLFRRGLDRAYQPIEEELATVRGHINMGGSLRLNIRKVRRLECEYDELSHDVPHNRVLRASLLRLSRAPSLDTALGLELRRLARRMTDVSDIKLDRGSFSRLQLHRNNAHYDLLLRVSELAFDCLLPNEAGDGYRFENVLRDEKKMARVFESFVRNFYRHEQDELAVQPLTIRWDATSISPDATAWLPQMRVDVFLTSVERKIIIDTKYYFSALQTYHGKPSFNSNNLYQIFSYLKNAAAQDAAYAITSGMLLYPQVGRAIDAHFEVQGHQIQVLTLDLSENWTRIRKRLLDIISDSKLDNAP